MKHVAYLLGFLSAIWVPASAQTGASGTWLGEAASTVVLKANGPALTGTISNGGSNPQPIFDGRIDGNAVTFKSRTADGDRTITFTGRLDGDEIVFTRDVQVREGGRRGGRGIFGVEGPQRFTVKRVAEVHGAGVEVASAVNPPRNDTREWIQPPRSQANLDALARVQVKSYTFTEANNLEMEYGLYVPTVYNAGRPMPLVVALHGANSGISYMMEYHNLLEHAERYGYIVATPMGYSPRGWYGSRGPGNAFSPPGADPGPANLGYLSEQDVLNVLKVVRGEFNVDSRRLYLIGQSMGGGGTLYLGSKFPDVWAALAAMAPAIYSTPDILEAARHIPLMIIQGDADHLVDVNVTRHWAAKMKVLQMTGEYIEVRGGTHASAGRENIDKVFAFLEKHRKP